MLSNWNKNIFYVTYNVNIMHAKYSLHLPSDLSPFKFVYQYPDNVQMYKKINERLRECHNNIK